MRVTCSMSMSEPSSSCTRYSKASATFMRRFLVRGPKSWGSRSLRLVSESSGGMLLPVTISIWASRRSRTSISTERSSSLPSRNCSRRRSRSALAAEVSATALMVSPSGEGSVVWAGGTTARSDGDGWAATSRSSRRSSAFSSALSSTSSSFSSRTMSMAFSTRSRIMDSTSRPT